MVVRFSKVMYWASRLLALGLFFCCNNPNKVMVSEDRSRASFAAMEQLFFSDLKKCIVALDQLAASTTTEHLRIHFRQCRTYFKALEPVLSYVDSENYKFLNQPNIPKVEEEDFTDIKIKQPQGFQVMEEAIFSDTPHLEIAQKQANIISGRLRLIQKNTRLSYLRPYHFLWLLRHAILRVALTGITGFDSSISKNALSESTAVYQSIQRYLRLFEPYFDDPQLLEEWNTLLETTLVFLQGDFKHFDHYHFIKNHTQPTLQLWQKTVSDWKVIFPFTQALCNDSSTLFSTTTFNISFFSSESFDELNPEKVRLGAQLFQEKALSSTGTMSCASCHRPTLHYSDGQKMAKGATRNSPTLLYAALQKGWFYDRRAGSLEGQITSVIKNKNEFHSDLKSLSASIAAHPEFEGTFEKLYKDGVSEANIRNAIATYIRSLNPFNSKFDRNMRGAENTLTKSEIHGFNLFSGKAQCASCHFAPLFNGTPPPRFQESEMELIGVPRDKDSLHPMISTDLGRYQVYQTPERKHFFKTPTVRNSSKTAPYMHNGVFATLEEVIDFYDKGGGAGLGIDLKYQTLPTSPLKLTQKEKKDLIAFLKTLEDPVLEY